MLPPHQKNESQSASAELSVVIPVYNSRPCLVELIRQLTQQFDERRYEVILVDDGSSDGSWKVIKKLAAEHPQVAGISMMCNRGQAHATLCGLSYARGEVVVTMDDDLQHSPQELLKLLKALESNPEVDCVFAYFKEKHHAFYRNLGSSIIRWIDARALGLPRNIRWSAFRAMRRPLVTAVLQHGAANPVITALICQNTRQLMSISVQHSERYGGRSNYTLPKQLHLAIDNVCNVSLLPLRAVSTVGMAVWALTAVLIAVFLYKYFTDRVGIAGWTTIVILICFFSGLMLLSIGIVGEYMVRILREVRGYPRYIERERIGLVADRAAGEDPL